MNEKLKSQNLNNLEQTQPELADLNLAQQVDILKQQLAERDKELTREKEKNQKLEKENQDLKEEVFALRKNEIQELKTRIQELEEEKRIDKCDDRRLISKLRSLEEEIKKYQELIKSQNLREKELVKELQELKLEIEKLKHDLMHDKLTGLKTRAYFLENAEQDFAMLSRGKAEKRKDVIQNISYLFCDIDYFKQINDTYGHSFGDEILKEIASILQSSVRDTDTVCRWGGEEIVISLPGADEEKAKDLAEKLRQAVEEIIAEKHKDDPKYQDLKVTLSIGVASYRESDTLSSLMNRADQAVYFAKHEGRNCVKTHSELKKSQKNGDSPDEGGIVPASE